MTDAELATLLRPLMPRVVAAVEARLFGGDPYAPEPATFSAFTAHFTADDAPQFDRYFAADGDLYPANLHAHFGCQPREFADRTGLARKQITDKNGHRVWHWVRRDQPPAAPQSRPAQPATPDAAHQLVPGPTKKIDRAKRAAVDKLSKTKGGRAVLGMGRVGWNIFHAVERRLMYVSNKVGELAARAVEERGFPPDRAERLRHALKAADFMGGYASGAAATAAGMPLPLIKASMFLPTASVLYLAYSTAVNPRATWRAARRVLRDTFAKADPNAPATHAAESGKDFDADALTLADALKSAADPDWFVALFCAALAATGGDVPRAVSMASVAERESESSGGIEMTEEEFSALPPDDEPDEFADGKKKPKATKVKKKITVHKKGGGTYQVERLVNVEAVKAAKPTGKAEPTPKGESAKQQKPADAPAAKKPAEPKKKRTAEKKKSDKATRALNSAVRVDKTIQRYAEEYNEPRMAKLLGGCCLPDSEACDVKVPLNADERDTWMRAMDDYRTAVADYEARQERLPEQLAEWKRLKEEAATAHKAAVAAWRAGGKEGDQPAEPVAPERPLLGERPVFKEPDGSAGGLFELKTLTVGENDKLTMDKYAQARKIVTEREAGAPYHTIASDDRQVIDIETGQPRDESKRVYYYRRGVAGSARIGTMHKCESEEELLRLIATPEDELPEGAKRTDAHMREGEWVFFEDGAGKGYKNTKTGDIARPKK